MVTEEVKVLAQKLWDYHHMNQTLEKSDCILVLGSHDTRVAEYAAELFLAGWAPLLVFSGTGFGHKHDLLSTQWGKAEAEIFSDIAIQKGVPRNAILIENKSTNTGENIVFSKQLLREAGRDPQSFIVVQKPYMERRSFATFKKHWPDKKLIVTSPRISLNDYPNEEITLEVVINLMVGDIQRIKVYPTKGFQVHQEIPADVWQAYERLVELGYNKHMVRE